MTNSPTGRRAVAYVRTSTADPHSPEAQTASILKWADQNNIYILKWFKEVEGRNPRGTAHTRGQFQALLTEIREGRWDVLVVSSVDRLARTDSLEFARFTDILRSNGCKLFSVDDGHEQRMSQGEAPSPPRLRGLVYMRVATSEQLRVPVPAGEHPARPISVEAVQEMFRLYASGELNIEGVCERLNQRHSDEGVAPDHVLDQPTMGNSDNRKED